MGDEKGVYRVRFSPGYFLPHLITLFVAGIGSALFLGADSGIKAYVGGAVFILFLFPLGFLLWRTIPTLFDELRIFDEGFTYKSRRGLQSCRWGEIEDHSEILDIGNRLKITSVEKSDGEKITFAYKMRGLDVLYHDLAEVEYSQIPEDEKARPEDLESRPQTLGAITATYHVKLGFGTFVPLAAVLFLAAFGVGTLVVSQQVQAFFFCAGPTLLALGAIAWSTFSSRRDQLKIYENGFTYQTRKELVTCLWDEIEDYSTTRRGNEISGIKKEDGPWISFANEMQGLEDLRPHLRTVVKWTGPEE